MRKIDAKGKVVDFVKGDLQKFDEINSVFDRYDIEAVVHFAAYSQVGESVKNPQKYYFNNVYGTLNLLKIMLRRLYFPQLLQLMESLSMFLLMKIIRKNQ